MDHKLNMMFIHDCYFFFFYCIIWHVGSYFLDQEGICTPCNGSTVLTAGLSGKSLLLVLKERRCI